MRFRCACILGLLVLGVTAGCTDGGRDDRASMGASPLAESCVEVVEGEETIIAAVRTDADTRTLYEDENSRFEVGESTTNVSVEITWTPSSPASQELEASLGSEGGEILARSSGTSPLVLAVDGSIEPGEWRIGIWPAADVGTMASQTVHWTAQLTRATCAGMPAAS